MIMINEIYTRKQAIAEFVHNNTCLTSLMGIINSLYKNDGVFQKYVWYNEREFNDAVKDWSALDIIKATPCRRFAEMEFFHISEDRIFSGANYMGLSNYMRNEHVERQVIDYLVQCTHGHTGDDILDGIVNSSNDTRFDDSFYIYHEVEERPEDYDD